MSETQRGLPRTWFKDHVGSAYDLGSGGVGIQLHAVNLLDRGALLPDWAQDALKQRGSNYLATPYTNIWRSGGKGWKSLEDFGPHHLSPASEAHLALFERMFQEYTALEWKACRMAMAGENDPFADNAGKPIANDEIQAYLIAGVRRSLVVWNGDFDNLPNLSSVSTVLDFINIIHRNNRNKSVEAIDLTGNLFDLAYAIILSKEMRPKLRAAAVHKLATMLAVTDQLGYDARQSGEPLEASYRPQRFNTAWKDLFGESVPTFEGLIKHAQRVFTRVADREDPLVAHLFDIDPTQYFVK